MVTVYIRWKQIKWKLVWSWSQLLIWQLVKYFLKYDFNGVGLMLLKVFIASAYKYDGKKIKFTTFFLNLGTTIMYHATTAQNGLKIIENGIDITKSECWCAMILHILFFHILYCSICHLSKQFQSSMICECVIIAGGRGEGLAKVDVKFFHDDFHVFRKKVHFEIKFCVLKTQFSL